MICVAFQRFFTGADLWMQEAEGSLFLDCMPLASLHSDSQSVAQTNAGSRLQRCIGDVEV